MQQDGVENLSGRSFDPLVQEDQGVPDDLQEEAHERLIHDQVDLK